MRLGHAWRIVGLAFIAGVALSCAARNKVETARVSSPPGRQNPHLLLDAQSAEGDITTPPLRNRYGRARRIGDYQLFPIVMEVPALETVGDFETVTGRSLAQLKYDIDNPLPLSYDLENAEFSESVPAGSLVLIRQLDEDGTSVTTCVLLEDDQFVYYAYPPGFYGSSGKPQGTGFGGSLAAFLVDRSTVIGYVPPGS